MFKRIEELYRKNSILSNINFSFAISYLVSMFSYMILKNTLAFWILYAVILLAVSYAWVIYIASKTTGYKNVFCIRNNLKLMKQNLRKLELKKLINILKQENVYTKEKIEYLMRFFSNNKKRKQSNFEMIVNITIAFVGLPYIVQNVSNIDQLVQIIILSFILIWIIAKTLDTLKDGVMMILKKNDVSEELESLLSELFFDFNEMSEKNIDKVDIDNKKKEISVNESYLRNLFASIVWTHKIQEKQADIYLDKYNKWMIAKNILYALTISGIIATIFVEGIIFNIISGILAFGNVFVEEHMKAKDYKELYRTHKKTALEVLKVRELILILIADVKTKGEDNCDLQSRRDSIYTMYMKACSEALDASKKAVEMAQIALKINKDNTFSDAEIDSYLPVELRRGE